MRVPRRGVVGFDIAGAEAGFPPTRHLDAFQHIAARERPLHDPRRRGVRAAVDLGGAAVVRRRPARPRRADRRRHHRRADGRRRARAGSRRYVRDKRIPLEMCPSSQRADRRGAEHRRAPDRAAAAAVVPGHGQHRQPADERGVADQRDAALVEAFGYGWDDLRWLTVNAMKSSFLPFDERLRAHRGDDQAGLRDPGRRRGLRAVEPVQHGAGAGQAQPGGAGLDHRERRRGVADPAAWP